MHSYEKTISDINHEYTKFLIHILSPLIYEGIKSMYDKSVELEKKYIDMSKENINVKNPGILKIFQHFIKNIPSLNLNLIESEMIRIRDASKHADIFEKLIKAVIKSQIILLTYNASGKQCKLVNEKFHEKVDCKIFIHKIYIESARQFYNNPELFWHGYTSLDIKKNQRECMQIIENSINVAIKEIIPMNDILIEYLKNDYIQEDTLKERSNRIKTMLKNQPEDNINFFDDDDKKILLSDDENDDKKILLYDENDENDENDNNNLNENINDIENLLQEVSIKSKSNNISDKKIENDLPVKNNLSVTNLDEGKFKEQLHNFGNRSNKVVNMKVP